MTTPPERTDMTEITEGPREYLIRKGAYYYRPNAQGYTGNKQEAGLYTFAEAWAYSHPNGEDGPCDGIDFVHQSEVPDPIRTELASTKDALTAAQAEAEALREVLAEVHSLFEEGIAGVDHRGFQKEGEAARYTRVRMKLRSALASEPGK